MILGVDVGGTFTDAALLTRDRLHTAKVPTTPADQSEGVMAAVEEVLREASAEAEAVSRFVHGMTVGTNALLEGKIARTALLATEGFTDLEELGRQARPELYRLCAGNPPPLVPAELRVPVPERTGPDGVLRDLDEEALRRALDGIEVDAAAVCLLWGFLHPGHEQRVEELLGEELPGVHVSTSHETAGVFREYERCATTVVDAALSPLLRGYLERLAARAEEAALPAPEIMLSSGGTAGAGTGGSTRVLDRPLGARGRSGGSGAGGGRGRRRGSRHGRHLLRRIADRGWRRGGGQRARGGWAGARAADGGCPHRGGGRRIDRLARRRRSTPRWPLLRRRRPRSGLLRARR